MTVTSVWIVQHVAREDRPGEDVKLIGVYSTLERAEAAVARLGKLSGFREFLDGFYIDEYRLDEDHWTEGFGLE